MAVHGLRVWDSATQQITLDISDRITRIIGSFTISKDAKVDDTGYFDHEVFARDYFIQVKYNTANEGRNLTGMPFMIQAKGIVFTQSGTRLTWRIRDILLDANIKQDIEVVYGEY